MRLAFSQPAVQCFVCFVLFCFLASPSVHLSGPQPRPGKPWSFEDRLSPPVQAQAGGWGRELQRGGLGLTIPTVPVSTGGNSCEFVLKCLAIMFQ